MLMLRSIAFNLASASRGHSIILQTTFEASLLASPSIALVRLMKCTKLSCPVNSHPLRSEENCAWPMISKVSRIALPPTWTNGT